MCSKWKPKVKAFKHFRSLTYCIDRSMLYAYYNSLGRTHVFTELLNIDYDREEKRVV